MYISYDSFLDDQPSKCPFRIIRYNYNGKEGQLKFYKKQKEYDYDSIDIEKYIKNLFKTSEKRVSDISTYFMSNERIVNYKLFNKIYEIHFDKDEIEYNFNDEQMKEYINNIEGIKE